VREGGSAPEFDCDLRERTLRAAQPGREGHWVIKRWLGRLRSPQWLGVTWTDRHAGAFQCTSAEDKKDIDRVKQRMAPANQPGFLSTSFAVDTL